ncbi:invasion protein CiaB [Campylobacter mucosalis]|uniref:invasion protein CiaB n=1 Tax=Campylobacter mucosalis TaxID=202 RepID=UPI00146FE371|nr:invasion protein CiaB [Campylobacter mucosalis]
MNNFKRLAEILKDSKNELNSLYKTLDGKILDDALAVSGLSGSKSERMALLRRIVDLKVDPLENELKKLGKSDEQIKTIKKSMFEFVKNLYEKRFLDLIFRVQNEKILDEFNLAIIRLMHDCGVVLNGWQVAWEEHILDTINAEFDAKFDTQKEASEFCDKFELFMRDEYANKADRVYGAVIKTGDTYELKPYAVVFEKYVKELSLKFDKNIEILTKLAKNEAHQSYITYFKKLKEAFCERDINRVILAWQNAEEAWMSVRGELQPGHPLEYYEDAYTHAVALEWDIRLAGSSEVDETKFKQNIISSYEQICKNIGSNNPLMNAQVVQNVNRTQLYVSVPLIFYGAELNGLFSAQVVPNDESVSQKCGKKIFAFIDHVYESAKAKPFMKLSSEIFSKEFLDFNREILFLKPNVWKKVYEISTIGHEFGHILFIDKDTETTMNKGGVFKFIEEYKATTGGLINFFFHEQDEYKMAVFAELIARSVGLIAWREVSEVRAYYCEGLIHLSLLFSSGVLKFDDKILSIDFTQSGYERFKKACLANYELLAKHYSDKLEAGEFLSKFCINDSISYLPKDTKTADFVQYFYDRYKAIGNELDDSDEWTKWQKRANEI